MGKPPRLPLDHPAEPMLNSTMMLPQASVFPHGPADQKAVQMTEDGVQCGSIKAPVVLSPAPEDPIPHARQVIDGFVARRGHAPPPHALTHLGRRSRPHRRREVDNELAPSIRRPPRAKRVSQEIGPLLSIPARPVVILAVDDARLFGTDFQSTLREPTSPAACASVPQCATIPEATAVVMMFVDGVYGCPPAVSTPDGYRMNAPAGSRLGNRAKNIALTSHTPWLYRIHAYWDGKSRALAD
jgi:hypothetical protein